MKARSKALSKDLKAITSKFDAKGTEPVDDSKMPILATFLATLKKLPSQTMLVDFHLDKTFSLNNTKCMFTRTVLPFGGPLEGYANTATKESEQEKKTKAYILDKLEQNFYKAAQGGYSDYVTVYYFMTSLILDIILAIAQQDGTLAVFSIFMVFFYIWITTGSGFLALVGMSEIILSLPVAWFFVRCILQVKYFGFLNFLTIFIVCAIGADDIFVFMVFFFCVLMFPFLQSLGEV